MNETKLSKRDKLILAVFLPALALGLYWHFSARPLTRETNALRDSLATLGAKETLLARQAQQKTQTAALREKLTQTVEREQSQPAPPPPLSSDTPALKRVQDLFRNAGMILTEATADSAPTPSNPTRADIAATLQKNGVKSPQRWQIKARGPYPAALRVLTSGDSTIIIESASFTTATTSDDGSREWTFSFFL